MYGENTYIVTGCTGYVGNVLTKKLLADGCKVVGFARSEKKAARVFGDNLPQMVYGDITNADDIERLFLAVGENAVVIHTVAKVSIGEASEKELQAVTVEGTRRVVEACIRHKAKKLLHISSTDALPKVALDEDLQNFIPDPARAKKGYAKAKSMADEIVFHAAKEGGMDASILIFASVLGPGDYGKSHMSQMFIDYIEGRLPASIKGGYNDFDIRDVADVLPQIVERSKKGEAYIFAHQPSKINDSLNIIREKVGGKKLISLPLWLAYVGAPFLSLAAKITGKRPLYTAAALSAIREDANFPIEKAKKEFGFSPRSLQETVSDQVDFLIAEGMVTIK